MRGVRGQRRLGRLQVINMQRPPQRAPSSAPQRVACPHRGVFPPVNTLEQSLSHTAAVPRLCSGCSNARCPCSARALLALSVSHQPRALFAPHAQVSWTCNRTRLQGRWGPCSKARCLPPTLKCPGRAVYTTHAQVSTPRSTTAPCWTQTAPCDCCCCVTAATVCGCCVTAATVCGCCV